MEVVTSMADRTLLTPTDYNATIRPCQRHIHFSQDRDLAADNALWGHAKRIASPAANGRRRRCRRLRRRRRRRRLFVHDCALNTVNARP